MKKQHRDFLAKYHDYDSLFGLTSGDKQVLLDILATYKKQDETAGEPPVIRHRWFVGYEVVLDDNTTKKGNITIGTDKYVLSNRDIADAKNNIELNHYGTVTSRILTVNYMGSGTIDEVIGE